MKNVCGLIGRFGMVFFCMVLFNAFGGVNAYSSDEFQKVLAMRKNEIEKKSISVCGDYFGWGWVDDYRRRLSSRKSNYELDAAIENQRIKLRTSSYEMIKFKEQNYDLCRAIQRKNQSSDEDGGHLIHTLCVLCTNSSINDSRAVLEHYEKLWSNW